MEVKDYSQKLDQARDRFRENTSDIRNSYEKANKDLKENFEYRRGYDKPYYREKKMTREDESNYNKNFLNILMKWHL